MSAFGRFLDPLLLERLSQLRLAARGVVEGGTAGVHRSPVRGASVEFRQHRIYSPGDEPRRIDWRVLGRTDRPFVKQYDAETNLRCLLLLDASGSMAYAGHGESKFDHAARLLASLAYLLLSNSESVGLCVVGETGDWLAPRGGTQQLSRILESLERAAPAGPSAVAPALHRAAGRLGRRSLVVVASDCMEQVDAFRGGLAHLRHDRHEVLLFRVLDRDEIEFPFRHWSRFRDLEGGGPRVCDPAIIRREYLKNFRSHAAALGQAARALGVESHNFITHVPLHRSLLQFLQKREATAAARQDRHDRDAAEGA